MGLDDGVGHPVTIEVDGGRWVESEVQGQFLDPIRRHDLEEVLGFHDRRWERGRGGGRGHPERPPAAATRQQTEGDEDRPPQATGIPLNPHGPSRVGKNVFGWGEVASGQSLRPLAQPGPLDMQLGDGEVVTFRAKVKVSFKYDEASRDSARIAALPGRHW